MKISLHVYDSKSWVHINRKYKTVDTLGSYTKNIKPSNVKTQQYNNQMKFIVIKKSSLGLI